VESRCVTAWRQMGHRQGAAPAAWFHTLRMHSAAGRRQKGRGDEECQNGSCIAAAEACKVEDAQGPQREFRKELMA